MINNKVIETKQGILEKPYLDQEKLEHRVQGTESLIRTPR